MILGAAELQQLARSLELPGPAALGARACGEAVATSRSSWVRRCRSDAGDYFVKTYDYPTWRDRLRGALRNTGPLRRSRAAREFAALQWLGRNGFGAPRPVGVIEERRLGFVRRAVLVTEAWPGRPLDRLLPELPPADRERVGRALGAFVGALHRAGFRSRNLDLRNVLAATDGDAFRLALLDAPRHVLRPAGRTDDALARADWDRLLPQLAAFDLAQCALAGAASPATAT